MWCEFDMSLIAEYNTLPILLRPVTVTFCECKTTLDIEFCPRMSLSSHTTIQTNFMQATANSIERACKIQCTLNLFGDCRLPLLCILLNGNISCVISAARSTTPLMVGDRMLLLPSCYPQRYSILTTLDGLCVMIAALSTSVSWSMHP